MSVYVTGGGKYEPIYLPSLGEGDVVFVLGSVGPGAIRCDGCEVAVVRGSGDPRGWVGWSADGTERGPVLTRWCGEWVMLRDSEPDVMRLPDCGGALEVMGMRILVLPSASVPKVENGAVVGMLDTSIASTILDLVDQFDGRPDVVISYSCPVMSDRDPDARLLSGIREAYGLEGIPWFCAASGRASSVDSHVIACPNGVLTQVLPNL